MPGAPFTLYCNISSITQLKLGASAARSSCGISGRDGPFNRATLAVDPGRRVTPAAEWLLDNYHLVEAQILEIREDLPPGFYRLLPKLAGAIDREVPLAALGGCLVAACARCHTVTVK